MLERGGYDDMDVCLMWAFPVVYYDIALICHVFRRCHPGPGSVPMFDIPGSLAIQPINVEFFGHTSVHLAPLYCIP